MNPLLNNKLDYLWRMAIVAFIESGSCDGKCLTLRIKDITPMTSRYENKTEDHHFQGSYTNSRKTQIYISLHKVSIS